MKPITTLVVTASLCIANAAFSQSDQLEIKDNCTLCGNKPVVIYAKTTSKDTSYYLDWGNVKKKTVALGKLQNKQAAVEKFNQTISKQLGLDCNQMAYQASDFVNFVNSFSNKAANFFFPDAGPNIVASIDLDNENKLVLIKCKDDKYIISKLGTDATGKEDIMTWDNTTFQYSFNPQIYRELLLSTNLPKILYLKEVLAKVEYPKLYLLYDAPNSQYLIIEKSDNSTSALTKSAVSESIGDTIKLANNEEKLFLNDKRLNVEPIKNYDDATQEAALKPKAPPVLYTKNDD